MPVKYTASDMGKFTLVEFMIEGGILTVNELKKAVEDAPNVDTSKGVCISGRGPIWLYVALKDKYHPTKFVATYEPRLNACVVAETHTNEVDIGDILEITK